MLKQSAGIMTAAALVLSGCGDASGPAAGAPVAVAFTTSGSAAQTAGMRVAGLAAPVTVEGTNGTLVLDDVRLIVAEFELERSEDGAEQCESLPTEEEQEACEREFEEDYEADPYFLQVPLGGSTVNVAQAEIPSGSYSELEFEVEDIDLFEEEDEDKQAALQAVAAAIAAAGFDDWPAEASMVAIGTFTPEGGEPRSFKVYFEAEVEVELEFDQPLVIEEGTPATITIHLDPAAWFTNADGSVMDLSQFDYTGEGDDLVEFEVEMEDGFTEIEIDMDD